MHIQLPDDVQYILRRLRAHGHSAYIVGGCVRDALSGQTPHDYDVCTSATPAEMQACFADCRLLATGLAHGTLTVVLHGVPYEMTTFRRDGAYADHRHPDSVSFTDDILADLRRRDFTVNSMAFHPDAGLLDPFAGEADIRAGVIRCVGDPDMRFNEDALRILRAMRFASTLGFTIDTATARSMRAHAKLLSQIAPERIAAELTALLLGQSPRAVLSEYADVLSVCIPEILPCVGFAQRSRYHHLTVWEHTCLSVQNAPQNRVVRLTLLLHDIGKPACFTVGLDGYGHFYGHPAVGAQMAEAILTRLRYDTETVKTVACLIRDHDAALTATKPAVRRWLNRLGLEKLRLLLDVKRADASAHADPAASYANIQAFCDTLAAVRNDKDCFSLRELAIDGNDLLNLSIPKGPEIGSLLRRLLEEVMDGTLENTHDELLARAKALMNSANRSNRDSND